MATILWIIGGIVGILGVGLASLFLWDWLNGPSGPIFNWQIRREAKRRVAGMSKEELAAAAVEARQFRTKMMARQGGTAAMMAIQELTASSDVSGLLSAFSLGDWQTRELAITALGNVCRDSRAGIDYDRREMVAALRAITDLCKADATGGSYRQNCLDHARMLLGREDLQHHTN